MISFTTPDYDVYRKESFMLSYYSAIILMSLIALGVLSLLIRDNNRLSSEDKRLLYVTCSLIAVSAIAEWGGVQMDGRKDIPVWILLFVKCLDYILTPMAGGSLAMLARKRSSWHIAIIALIAVNTVYQIISIFFGWIVFVDAQHHYHHGPIYFAYLLLCLGIIILMILSILFYSRSFSRQNRRSLYAVMAMVVAGIAMQELIPGNPRTAYIGLTLGAAMMYIHFTEYNAVELDEQIVEQQIQIDRDELTGVYNRHRFAGVLQECNEIGQLPEDLVAFVIDINGLKEVNDTKGHEKGDLLIRGAARCIEETLTGDGYCFRTGGDEFVVLTRMSPEKFQESLETLKTKANEWRCEDLEGLKLAIGFAFARDYENCTAGELIKEADFAMYDAKAAYYAQTGKERRKRRTERRGRHEAIL